MQMLSCHRAYYPRFLFPYLIILSVVFAAGCSGWTHGVTLAERTQRMHPASVGTGATSLAIESAYDQTLRSYMEDHGTPDYVYVVDRYTVHLIYLNTDTIATFTRGYTSNSTVAVRQRIPDAMLAQLAEPERSRVLSARGEASIGSQRPKSPTAQAAPDSVPPQKQAKKPLSVGTCFAVSADGLLVTAYHVISEATTIEVYLPDGTVTQARVERASPSTDLVLLRIKRSTPVFLSPADTGSLSVGQRVFTVGYPAIEVLGVDPKFSEGAINSLSGPGGDAHVPCRFPFPFSLVTPVVRWSPSQENLLAS